MTNTNISITKTKLIICALGNLHYRISREQFVTKSGFQSKLTERQARDLEVRGLNLGSG